MDTEALLPRRLLPHELRAQADLDSARPPVQENTDAYLGDPVAYYNEIDLDVLAFEEIVKAGQNGDDRVLVGFNEVRDRVTTRYDCNQNAGGPPAPATKQFIVLIDSAITVFTANDFSATPRLRREVHGVRAALVKDFDVAHLASGQTGSI